MLSQMKLHVALLRTFSIPRPQLARASRDRLRPLTFFHSSLVSFGPKQRAIGELAKTQEISNFKNTIGSLKRLIGRTLTDPDISEIESKFTAAKLVDVNGTVGAQVSYSYCPPIPLFRPSPRITDQLRRRAANIFRYPTHRHVLGKTS